MHPEILFRTIASIIDQAGGDPDKIDNATEWLAQQVEQSENQNDDTETP
jgi:hypothetical protein